MPGPFVHLELHTDDVQRAKDFYAELFGWSYRDVPTGEVTYTMITTGTEPGGGMQAKGAAESPTVWLPYIAVDDIHSVVERARAKGAEVVVPYMEAPGFGEGAILRDPTGASFGIWRATGPAAAVQAQNKTVRTGKKKTKRGALATESKPAKVAKVRSIADARAKKAAKKTKVRSIADARAKAAKKPKVRSIADARAKKAAKKTKVQSIANARAAESTKPAKSPKTGSSPGATAAPSKPAKRKPAKRKPAKRKGTKPKVA